MRPFHHSLPRPTLLRLVLVLLLCGVSLQAPAQSCGDTLSGTVVMGADLHCTSGWYALDVSVPGVTLDLNGHTLSGDRALMGVAVNGAHHLTIKGPGVIKGFWVGVNGVRSDEVEIEGVAFAALGAGIILNNSDALIVRGNKFEQIDGHAVTVSSLPGSPGGSTGGHLIAENEVREAVFGFQLCGERTGNSWIFDNRLEHIRDYGIHLEDGTLGNRIEGNTLADVGNTGIRIAGSSHNKLSGNYLQRGRIGIALYPELGGYCDTGSARAEVRENVIRYHSIFEQETAIVVGLGTTRDPVALKNLIQHNKLYYDDIGIRFLDDSYANDGRFNAYAGTVTPVVDHGRSNVW